MQTLIAAGKGSNCEELLRAFFLRAGFFVVRGVPVRFNGIDATDVDLWLYERPSGTARRRQITDAKFKQRPKAFERLLWTRGLVEILDVDGAYVATTDRRSILREVARNLGLTLIDGRDLERMLNSKRILYNDRLTEEELIRLIRAVDSSHGSKDLYNAYMDLKSSIATGFGVSLINIALEYFEKIARTCVTSHPNSEAARVSGRLVYFCSSLSAAALDFISISEPFKSSAERRRILIDAVRFGSTSKEEGMKNLNLAVALIRRYAMNGQSIASMIERRVESDFDKIPAEVIADQSIRMFRRGQIFESARALEHACFSKSLPSFDSLDLRERGFLGALLDFSSVDRRSFAKAWVSQMVTRESNGQAEQEVISSPLKGLARNKVENPSTAGSLFQEES